MFKWCKWIERIVSVMKISMNIKLKCTFSCTKSNVQSQKSYFSPNSKDKT